MSKLIRQPLLASCLLGWWLCSLAKSTEQAAEQPIAPAVAEVSDYDIAARVAELQSRLEKLEAENQSLMDSLHTRAQSTGIIPANVEMWNTYPDSTCPPQCQCPRCAPEKLGKGDWSTDWHHGIEWSSPDTAFKVHIGGRVQFDGVWYNDSSTSYVGTNGVSGVFGGPFATPGAGSHSQDAVAFRRARLLAEGTMYEFIDYAVEFDFVNSTSREAGAAANTEGNTINVPAPTDLWMNFRELVWGANLRVGNMKEPIAFEHQISSRYLNFLERSYIQDLFAGPFNNGFTPGVMLHDTWCEERGTWQVGGFKNGNNIFGYDVGNGEYAADARVTYLPIDCPDEHELLHIGLSGSARDPDADLIRFRTRSLRNGTGNLATIFADTGNFTTSMQWLAGAEVAGIWGPMSFQAEWVGSWCEDSASITGTTKGFPNLAVPPAVSPAIPLGTVYTNAFYVELHYFLTDDTRDYDRKLGRFVRIVPKTNFRWAGGCCEPGAWQMAFRYGAADLRDGALNGGLLQDYTVGVNWFLNPNMKVQWNYVATERDSAIDGVSDGWIHGFGMRLAYDF